MFTCICIDTLDIHVINNNRIFGNIFLPLKQKEINSTCDCSLSRAVTVTLLGRNWAAQWCWPVCKNQVLAAMCFYSCMFWFTLWSDFSFLKILFVSKEFPYETIRSQWQIIVWQFFLKRATNTSKIPPAWQYLIKNRTVHVSKYQQIWEMLHSLFIDNPVTVVAAKMIGKYSAVFLL